MKGRPKTLGDDFIDDLLEVTRAGKARDFESARDHAMIRILRSEGIRRARWRSTCGRAVITSLPIPTGYGSAPATAAG